MISPKIKIQETTMLTGEYWQNLSRIILYTGRVYNKPEHRKILEGIARGFLLSL